MKLQSTGDSGRLQIVLTEPHREVGFDTTLDGDTIMHYIDVFRAALRAFGFAEATVQKHLPEAE